MKLNGRLELTWTGKNDQQLIERRILIEDKNKSYGDPNSENMLIHGDNLLALKALEKDYSGKVKCIFIDPPYNTGTAFEHYDDNLEHSIWLNMMNQRLIKLKKLLSENGIIFVQIDYNEQAYLKVLMDEIFGRINFLTMITCKVKAPSGIASGANAFFDCSEYILVYTKNKQCFDFLPTKIDSFVIGPSALTVTNVYNQFIENWTNSFENFSTFEEDVKICEMKTNDFSISTIKKSDRTEEVYYENYKKIFRVAAISGGRDKKILSYLQSLPNYDKNNIYSYSYIASQGKNKGKLITNYIYKGGNILFLKDFVRIDDEKKKVYKQDIITNIFAFDWWQGLTGEGGVTFKNGQKPEKLIKTLLSVVTNPGDLVLDSFLGSGTTCAVAHKMNRKWIGIEMGEHVYSLDKVRMDSIIDGMDMTGITKDVGWKSGGGYHFYELSEPLFVKHPILGFYQLNPKFDDLMIKKFICNIEGYEHKENGLIHGFSSEKHLVHITRQFVNGEYVRQLMNVIGDGESISIYAMKYQPNLRLPDNIEIIDIMKKILPKCVDLKEEK